jgi:PIN domain nuclease of toxin-antitoxin system
MKVILDACAVIAFFRGEVGADIVEEYLFSNDYDCLIHRINLCEVYYDFFRSSGEIVAENMVTELAMAGVTFNDDLAGDFWRQVGKYKASIRRLSLADCFALTLANREQGLLVTSDRKEFEPVVPLNICAINFIR